jgi:GNAT superfamily N-acetyltransferase
MTPVHRAGVLHRTYRAVRRGIGRRTVALRRVAIQVTLRRDLTEPIPAYEARAPIEVRQATPADIRDVAAIRLPDLDVRDVYEQRLARGQRCFVARVGEEIVGSNWLVTGTVADEGRVMRLRDDEVYTFDAFTAPQWRGARIHGRLLHDMLETARDEHYRTAYTQVQAFRRRSRKGAVAFYPERVGHFLTIKGLRGAAPRMLRLTGSLYPMVGTVPPWDNPLR